MRKVFTLALASTMLFSLAGCSSTPAESSNEETKKETTKEGDDVIIGYATKSSSSPFWVENIKGAEQAAEELGIKLNILGPPVENDVAGQISVIEDMIASGSDALCIAPCGSVGVADVVSKAMDQGIPVVAVGDPIDGVDVTSDVSTDNYQAGRMGGEYIGEAIGGKGTVIITNGIIAQGGGKGRRDGFVDYMSETYGDAVKVVEVTGDWDDQKALSGFEAALAANPDVIGGYAAWDGAALVMYDVLQQNNRDDVTLCGFDCYDRALQLMKDDDPMFKADIAQNPTNMGYTAVMTAYNALMGKDYEDVVDTGTTLVTKENVEDYAKTMGVTLK